MTVKSATGNTVVEPLTKPTVLWDPVTGLTTTKLKMVISKTHPKNVLGSYGQLKFVFKPKELV